MPGVDAGLPGVDPGLPGVDLGLPEVDPGLAGVDAGPSQRPVGEVLEACRRSIGGLWGSFSRCLESPGGTLEHLEASWRPLGASRGPLEQHWGALGRLLAAS